MMFSLEIAPAQPHFLRQQAGFRQHVAGFIVRVRTVICLDIHDVRLVGGGRLTSLNTKADR
jgi:hypothetical protein